jgi:adenylate kinase
MLNIILCGAPGCGKGTQSELLKKKYNITHFSTGDILRAEIKAGTEIGLQAEEFISKGMLVPDEMIIGMLMKQIDGMNPQASGMILDGFPRTVEQARQLELLLAERNKETTLLIDIQVEEQELINRLLLRGQISGRSDDNAETIQKRLHVYHEKTAPVNNFYNELNKYFAVNGMGTIDEIFGRITEVIEKKI